MPPGRKISEQPGSRQQALRIAGEEGSRVPIHPDPIGRESHRRLEHPLAGKPAVALVGRQESGHRSRNSDRLRAVEVDVTDDSGPVEDAEAARLRLRRRQRVLVTAHGHGRHHVTLYGDQPVGITQGDSHRDAPAEAGRPRLSDAFGQRHGHRSIDGIAPRVQDLSPCPGHAAIRSRDQPVVGDDFGGVICARNPRYHRYLSVARSEAGTGIKRRSRKIVHSMFASTSSRRRVLGRSDGYRKFDGERRNCCERSARGACRG